MNYYNEIINNETTKIVKNYSINISDLTMRYNIGKLLAEAGKQYGEGIIKKYSKKLMVEFGKKYSVRYLFDMKKLYLFTKVHPLDALLTMSHYRILFSLKDDAQIDYYISQIKLRSLGKRELINIIRKKEYERLDEKTKNKLITKEKSQVQDYVKNPIIINNVNNYEILSEKILQKLVMEDMVNFLNELGTGFSFIANEYKIKIGNRYNYIDLLLFNYRYNCFVVIELKVTELKKQHIGQIGLYMNYIDSNLKDINQEKTIGIIICKKDNKFIMEYCSDKRIISKEYELI